MRSGSQRLAAAVAMATLVVVGASGCGREDPDLVAGKQLFVEKCGACHTLARAGTTGVNGPNLDEAFGPARRQGLGEGTVEGVTADQIATPLRNSGMPAKLVTGEDADDVAAYVAAVAGQPGEDQGRLAAAGAPEVSNKPVAAEGGRLEIDANPTGALAFESTKATAAPGPIEILSMNESPIPHNIALEQPGREVVEGPVVSTGGTSRLQADLKPGKYEFVCTVPGHEEGGMKGTLTVK
ncbi:MAG TPA: c-type cytochrome [Thermoleophilaceae bacterium]|nr:c-type cytochrome [Thermoleophilaceae bacterium]